MLNVTKIQFLRHKINYRVWFTAYNYSKKLLSSMARKVSVFKFAFSSFAFSRGDASLHMFLFISISLCNDDLHEEETEVRENGERVDNQHM